MSFLRAVWEPRCGGAAMKSSTIGCFFRLCPHNPIFWSPRQCGVTWRPIDGGRTRMRFTTKRTRAIFFPSPSEIHDPQPRGSWTGSQASSRYRSGPSGRRACIVGIRTNLSASDVGRREHDLIVLDCRKPQRCASRVEDPRWSRMDVKTSRQRRPS